jgi:hypothetical protein
VLGSSSRRARAGLGGGSADRFVKRRHPSDAADGGDGLEEFAPAKLGPFRSLDIRGHLAHPRRRFPG